MTFCPECKKDFNSDLLSCPRCHPDLREGNETSTDGVDKGWVVIGHVRDQTSADYARETLESYDVPAVVFSESGFFGQVGLNLLSPYGKHKGMFQIQVPSELVPDAINIMNMILGDSWEKAVEADKDEQ